MVIVTKIVIPAKAGIYGEFPLEFIPCLTLGGRNNEREEITLEKYLDIDVLFDIMFLW